MGEEEAIVLYPSPAIGHLISMIELGRLILTHRPSFSIHIVLPPAPYQADATLPYIAAVSASTPSITFHRLPPPPATTVFPESPHHEILVLETLRLSLPHLHRTLEQIISQSAVVHALILDFFSTAALSVAAELNIPGYHFSTSGAACLGFSLYLPTLHKTQPKSFGELGRTVLEIPGAPKLPASEVPKILLDRDDEVYRYFLEFTARLPESAGLIVNTFDELEGEAVKAISAGLCLPDGRPTPPLYCIGPLIGDGGGRKEAGGSGVDCLAWLDSQPKRSVVFLCFGSLGIFSREQLREIAIGLEKSGQRFLWVMRDPPSGGDKRNVVVSVKDPDLSLEGLLLEGFLERTKGRGHVVKSWAPQVDVLGHESIGGFVTHCGWNSVLEAVRAGVPMVAWPLYAEQKFNRVLLVEEIRIALPMVERDESGFVDAAEVERRVKELMEVDGPGDLVRRRMGEMKNASEDALRNHGTSRVELLRLLDSWRR
ncbi:unnamed protein product [Linum tenue]|uniref:Glycosyltransferase n=1 Tax=Linum tenue TaxID=586396 RepID=A0AAV0IZN3_9ROSI|nr:unnamed protein product [Linum tenue]